MRPGQALANDCYEGGRARLSLPPAASKSDRFSTPDPERDRHPSADPRSAHARPEATRPCQQRRSRTPALAAPGRRRNPAHGPYGRRPGEVWRQSLTRSTAAKPTSAPADGTQRPHAQGPVSRGPFLDNDQRSPPEVAKCEAVCPTSPHLGASGKTAQETLTWRTRRAART